MVGTKLLSGNLSDYAAVGTEGSPVYGAADQLRVAIRRQLGKATADLFAIPKLSDKRGTVEWYAPTTGRVVPWSAATHEERGEAKQLLVDAQQSIVQRSTELQQHDSSEQVLFGKLLEKAVRIPSDAHIYLVDGKPVITFWGFDALNVLATSNVITDLYVGEPAIAPTTETPVQDTPQGAAPATVIARRSIWRWLLPLLLLLLLLLFLWWWFLGRHQYPALSIAPVTVEDQREPLSNGRDINSTSSVNDERRYQQNSDGSYTSNHTSNHTSTGNSDYNRSTNSDDDAIGNESVRDDLDAAPIDEALMEEGDLAETDEDNNVDNDADNEPGGEEGLIEDPMENQNPDAENPDDSVEETSETPAENLEEESEEPATEEPTQDDPAENNPENPALTPQEGSPERSDQPSEENAGPLLDIPAAGSSNDDAASVMRGNWESTSSLIDGETGKPIKVEYDIDGEQGKARIRRSDGTVCSGNVRTSSANGQYSINGQSPITCPDGERYEPAKVTCSRAADGRTGCNSTYEGGESFPVQLRQSNAEPN